MGDRVIFGWILSDSSNYGTFGQLEIIDRLAEIAQRSSLDTQCILAQVDGVHIIFQNGILVHYFFQFQGKILFL